MSAQGPSYPAPRSSAVGAHDRSASAGQPAHGQQAQSRRAPSTSSIASSSGTAYSSARASVSTAAGKAGGMAAHLETTVTKLLVATKQLLEGLTDWSQGRITEEQVSDIYVRLGNCFNAAVAAFTKEGISMRDLKEVPSLLRVRLEDAINEEASRETLNKHLPRIRPIVLDLLRGLRQKQEQHAAMVAATAQTVDPPNSTSPTEPMPQYARRPSATPSLQTPPEAIASTSRLPIHEQGANRSREELGIAHTVPNGRSSPTPSFSASNPLSRPSSRNAYTNLPYGDNKSASESSHSARAPYEESTRRPSGSLRRPGSLLKSSSSSSSLRPGRSETPPPDMALPPLPNHSTSRTEGRGPLPFPVPAHHLQPPREDINATPPVIRMSAPPESLESVPLQPYPYPPSMPQPSSFATPPRSSLRPTNSIKKDGDDASLEALKKADPLARRASKRFSAYTFNKISSSTSIAGSPSSTFQGAFPPTPNRSNGIERDSSAKDFVNSGGRMDPQSSDASDEPQRRKPKSKSNSPRLRHRDTSEPPVPALPPLSSLPKAGLLPDDRATPRKKRVSIVAEETEDQLEADNNGKSADTSLTVPPTPPGKADRRLSNEEILRVDRSGSAVSIASSVSQYSAPDTEQGSSSRRPSIAPEVLPLPQKTIFLQLGRDMKKATLDSATPPTFASLRMLFTERFAYNPGLSDFPAIYLRDPTSGIQYELENIDEIKDHSILSLNIEPLDQVKQHIDEGLATLARELKDLKVTMSRRMSVAASAAQPVPLTAAQSPSQTLSPLVRQVPGESQIQQTAPDGTPMKSALSSSSVKSIASDAKAKNSPSAGSAAQLHADPRVQRLAMELRSSYDEVQSVRRELGALRQVYTDFRAETAGVLATLKTQTTHVKEIAGNKVVGDRAYIDEGKVKLDNRSQDLLTKIEELQDTIDDLKNDVVARKIKPKPKQMEAINNLIAAGQLGLDSLSQYIATVKPMWKKTWEAELQNIVDEQQLLNHQEELLADLRADHENVVTVFEQIQQYVSLQNTNKIKKPEFRPPSPEEGHQGLRTVMMEVKGLAPASDKRMRAIEMAEKSRQRETQDNSDEFAQELSGFVEGKLLKKTGGAEEIERIRQVKSEASLRAMFSQSGTIPSAPPPPVPPLPSAATNPGLGLSTGPSPAPPEPEKPVSPVSPLRPLSPSASQTDTGQTLSVNTDNSAMNTQSSSLEPSPTFSLPEDVDPGETVEWRLS